MQDLIRFADSTSFSTYFVHQGAQYSVTVTTPDLRQSNWSTWGDWGPTYTHDLNESQVVRVTYRSARLGLITEAQFVPSVLQLNSPMFEEQRQKFPCYIEFEDDARGIRFFAYFNQQGEVTHAEVETVNPDEDLDSLLFPEEYAQLSA